MTSLTGPNGAAGTTTYDAVGRPLQNTIPDGAVTSYTYTNYPSASGNTQTATLTSGANTRWKRTAMDGVGRVIRVDTGNGAATGAPVSRVDTQYGPCGCSPLGKVSAVSLPYAGEPVDRCALKVRSGRQVAFPTGSLMT